MILEGKSVIVSGVGPGLGREIGAAAVRDGARVMLAARVAWQVTDVTDPAHCERLAAATVERFGTIDAVVNNAALDTVFGGLEGADFGVWRKTFEVNVFGSLQLSQAALPALKQRGGSIVFVGTQAMYWSQVPQAAYGASKAALSGAVAHLAVELGPHKIRVNTVVPSWMWGPPVEAYVNITSRRKGVPPQEVIDGIAATMPLKEIPTDGDVAEAIIFFASDRARMITGQSLLVNAGQYIR
jgi:NAD(P)-dependent dehydrogenase (short-subunit alcohol dehydrogenase family)